MAFVDGQCIQDQYGNQYTLSIDTTHQYITGTMKSAQGTGPYILTGSYVQSSPSDSWIFELTGANSGGSGVPVFKLKGVEPKAAWYYQSGYGGQEFEFTECTVTATMAEAGKASLKPGEFRGLRKG